MNQWNHEIETRVKYHKLNVLVHHGSNRSTSVRSLCNYDIVLTTYGVVSSEGKTKVALHIFQYLIHGSYTNVVFLSFCSL